MVASRAPPPASAIFTDGRSDEDEALEAPIVAERKLVGRIPHGQAGEVPNLRSPVRMTGTPVRAPAGAPVLAEHTDAVLREVAGYNDARIAALREGGVVR